MKGKHLLTLVATIFAAVVVLPILSTGVYAVDETEYALELRFGQVKEVHKEPGLKVKMPLIDNVQRIDKRTIRADIPPREVPDRDKERVVVDFVVRYHITDPLQFRKTLRSEATAQERIQSVMYSAMRDTIAEHDRTELIGAQPKLDQDGKQIVNEEGLPVYESLENTRDQINTLILHRVIEAVNLQKFGIEIISADIKQADFPAQVTQAITDRLRSERQRVAASHRAAGDEQYQLITSDAQARADIIVAEAESEARQLRGEGDAEAIAIVQQALSRDTNFYRFLRNLESYEKSINAGDVLIMGHHPDGYLDARLNGYQEPGARGPVRGMIKPPR